MVRPPNCDHAQKQDNSHKPINHAVPGKSSTSVPCAETPSAVYRVIFFTNPILLFLF